MGVSVVVVVMRMVVIVCVQIVVVGVGGMDVLVAVHQRPVAVLVDMPLQRHRQRL